MKFLNILTGVGGIGFIELVTTIPSPDTIAEILKIAAQIVILAGTLIALFKKKKK